MQRIIILVSDVRYECAREAELQHREYLSRLGEHIQDIEQKGEQCVILWIVLGETPDALAAPHRGFNASKSDVRVVVAPDCDDELHESDIRDTIEHHMLCNKDIEIEASLELMPPPSLVSLPLWYYGLAESRPAPISDNLEVLKESLIEALPLPQKRKVGVWLELVVDSETYKNLVWDCSKWVDFNEVVSLLEFLWVFEEASGSDCNSFNVDHILESLGVAEFESDETPSYGHYVLEGVPITPRLPSSLEPAVSGKARRLFRSAEGMFFSLWYSCFCDYRYSTKEKFEMLFDLSSGSDEAERKLSSYYVVKQVL